MKSSRYYFDLGETIILLGGTMLLLGIVVGIALGLLTFPFDAPLRSVLFSWVFAGMWAGLAVMSIGFVVGVFGGRLAVRGEEQ